MILSSFEWMEHSVLGQWVNNSLWAFAVIEVFHLIALAVIGGAVLLVDLRLLGFGLRRQAVADVARAAQPWLVWSLLAIIITGIPLLASLAASKYYDHPAYWLKMYFLAAAIIFTFTIRQRVAMGDPARADSGLGKIIAIVSIILWSGVGIMGKGIGYW